MCFDDTSYDDMEPLRVYPPLQDIVNIERSILDEDYWVIELACGHFVSRTTSRIPKKKCRCAACLEQWWQDEINEIRAQTEWFKNSTFQERYGAGWFDID